MAYAIQLRLMKRGIDMKEFLDDDFLLDNETGRKLYHTYAENMPIFDFHCHLIPEQIQNDYHFENITEAWLGKNGYGDHYKWRLMREYGIDESYITGDKPDYDRFLAYSKMMPDLIGNPIYEWTHLELKKYFGIRTPLKEASAKEIYDEANKKLETLSARRMMELNNVKIVYTTDDPLDDLHEHETMKKDATLKTKVSPCMRPDKAIKIEESTFAPYVKKMAALLNRPIETLHDFIKGLEERTEYFIAHGCKATDHDIGIVSYKEATYDDAEKVFKKAMNGEAIDFEDQCIYKGYLLTELAKIYHKHDLVMQLHIGAIRNDSKRVFGLKGPDMGYDSVGDYPVIRNLVDLFSHIDETEEMPKTVVYCVNEKDYGPLVTMMNAFQDGKTKGKIQLGAAWWFNDHYDGIDKQLHVLASGGILSLFIGMLTDSRSFLSYPRHDYFRRELCNYLGSLVEKGRYPNDIEHLGKIIQDICYYNALHYFGEE